MPSPFQAVSRTPFTAVNATPITTTTLQVIKAAVAGKRHWITSCSVITTTDAETPFTALQGSVTGTVDVFGPGDPAIVSGESRHVYDPPILIPAGEDIQGIGLLAALGDVTMAVNGWVED